MKTIAKRLIAAVAAMTLLIPSASVWAAKGSTDVDIASGKSATSALWGEKNYLGQYATAVTSDDNSDLFIPCGSPSQVELITIDLGARYPINQIDAYTWGDNSATGWGFGTAQNGASFEFYVTNTKPSSKSDDISLKADSKKLSYIGEQQFVAKDSGGFDSSYALSTPGSYRYVQLRFVEGSDAPQDLRIGDIDVWTTAEAAANVPTVVSVGKPVYTAFWNPYLGNITKVNDGTNEAHGIFVPKGRKTDSSDMGSADIIMDLEGKYPIEMIDINTGNRDFIDDVLASNSPDFADDSTVSLYFDGEYYVLDEMDIQDFGNAFKYVKVVVATDATNADFYRSIAEISVYSTKNEAKVTTKKENRVNLALNATVTASNMGGAYTIAEGWKYMNDGSYSQSVLAYAGNIWIQYDLGGYYTIDSVRTIMHKTGIGGVTRKCAVEKILLSNSTSFQEDTTFVIPGDACRYIAEYNDTDRVYIKNSYSPAVAPSERRAYRYVRICMDGAVNGDSWQLNEIEVYGNKEETTMKNVIKDADISILTGTGSSWYSNKQNMVDGNEGTGAAAYGTVVFPLPYPMSIDRIEIKTRPGFDNDIYVTAGHDIWLAKSGDSINNSVKISDAYTGDAANLVRKYHAGDVVPYNVYDEDKYTHVFIRARNNGEFFVQEVRIMTNDTLKGTTIENELTGEQAKGQTLTLTTSWKCETAPTETVNLYIARYDNGALTDVKMSADKTLSGQVGSETFTYTITEDVTAQTEFKGFVWEKGTLNPFA